MGDAELGAVRATEKLYRWIGTAEAMAMAMTMVMDLLCLLPWVVATETVLQWKKGETVAWWCFCWCEEKEGTDEGRKGLDGGVWL